MRSLAYGAAGNYAIPDAIDLQAARTDHTGIFSHRKIVVRNAFGRQAQQSPVYREISVDESASMPAEQVRPRQGADFLIGGPVEFAGGIADQYAQCHAMVDLEDYLSMATEIGVLAPDQVNDFYAQTTFIPGGCELGIYPTVWLYPTLKMLAVVGREFVTQRADRLRTYDDYQVRAVGFLAERLGSYLLLREIARRYPGPVPSHLIGALCVIVPEGGSYYRATASR